MKKIINGKKYDTETATILAEYDDGLGWRDFNHLEMTLYRKHNGEYFLHGKGHAKTRYAQRANGNMYGAGADIDPMTEDEAKEWVEEYANGMYEDIFGECEE